MKKIIVLMLAVLIVLVALPSFMTVKNGTVEWQAPKAPEMPHVPSVTEITKMLPSFSTSQEQAKPPVGKAIYQWQDDSGQWHYSQMPPPGVEARLVNVNPDANVVHIPDRTSSSSNQPSSSRSSPSLNDVLPAQGDSFSTMVEKAGQGVKLMQEGIQQRQQALDGL